MRSGKNPSFFTSWLTLPLPYASRAEVQTCRPLFQFQFWGPIPKQCEELVSLSTVAKVFL